MSSISSEAMDYLESVIDEKIANAVGKINAKKQFKSIVLSVQNDGITNVQIPGVADTLPADETFMDVVPGDVVYTTIENGKAIIDGNVSNPGLTGSSTLNGVNISPGSILGISIADGTIVGAKLAAATITGSLIAESTIEGSNIKNSTITGSLIADSTITNANIADSTITGGKIIGSTLRDIPYASIVDADIEVARIADARIRVAVIDKAQIRDLEAEFANIQTLIAQKATIVDLTAANARIDNLVANYASIEYLEANYIDAGTIDAEYIRTDMMNANVSWIQNGTIANAAITNEMVHSVSANKLTAGTIDAGKINVANLRAENLVVAKINGQPALGGYSLIDKSSSGYSSSNPSALGWYELTNGSFVLSSDTQVSDSKVYYAKGTVTKLYDQDYIDGLEDGLNQRIDGAVETFTGSAIPTMSNYPVSGWTSSQYASHVGDIYYVIDPTSSSDGYCYRFAYDNTSSTYGWVLIKDSDVTKALSDISDLQTFESETVSWIDETDEGLRTIRQNHTALSGRVDKTVVETVQLWFTKADTTAPSKPTAHVTTNSASTPNAWNIAVPSHMDAYPNYYYCYEWKYADGTYGWSNVTRDIAMGESQSLSRTGVATANANIKSSVMLWFTKANDTAPSKPTSQVTTNNAATGNAWNIAVPTYNSAYPHYFYCYQQQKGDGTYQWTDVVYDRATSETQSTARATSSSLANYITTNNAAIDALQDQIDGAVDIWYGSSDPTSSTAPWPSTDSKDIHVGDLYYNTSNGHSFRYTKSGSTYSWTQIPDSDASAALAAAQDAQATADGKRRIFTTTPTVPYDIGDLWVNGSTVKYATVKKTGSQSYAASDWSLTATDDTMAKVNIKSNVQLWFTKANTTAPAKPTSVVTTNNASTPNAWNIAVPTYNSSYKNYFYCYQQQKGDGTYQWTDVVFDSATTETMAKSQAALPAATFTTFQQTTFKELVDEVDEQSSTITQMSEQIDKAQTVRTQEGSLGNRTIVTDDAADLPLLTLDPVYGESVQNGTPTPSAPVYIQAVRGSNDFANYITSANGTQGSNSWTGMPYGYTFTDDALERLINGAYLRVEFDYTVSQIGAVFSIGLNNITTGTNGYTTVIPVNVSSGIVFTTQLTGHVDWLVKPTTAQINSMKAGTGRWGFFSNDSPSQNHIGDTYEFRNIKLSCPLAVVSSIGSTMYLDMTDPSTGEAVELHGLDSTYRDVLRIDSSGHAVVEKRTDLKQLSDYTWTSEDSAFPGLFRQQLQSDKYTINTKIMCNHLVWQPGGQYNNMENGKCSLHNSIAAPILRIRDSSFSGKTSSELKQIITGYYIVLPLLESSWYTIDLGYVDLPTVTDDATVYVAAEVQPVIGGSWWTKAGYETGKTISTTVNSVKQTTDSNSAHISNLTSRLGLNADGTGTTTDIVSKYNQIDQDLDGLTTRVGKTESKTSLRYTFVRDNWTEANWATKTVGSALSISPYNFSSTGATTVTGFDSTSVIVGDLLMIQGTSTDSSNKNWHSLTCKVTSVPSSSSADIPTTIVAVDDTTALASRVTQAETSISQNATAITLRATKTELTSAIDGIEIGGKNLFKNSEKLTDNWGKESGNVSDGIVSLDASSTSRLYQVPANGYWQWEPNTEYVVSIEAKAYTGTPSISLRPYGANPSAGNKDIVIDTTWKRYSYAFTSGATILTTSMTIMGSSTSVIYLRKPKLEKGNKATDWTPAPEDMATSAELKVANDAISTKVEKNGVISSINQSSESITINANRVNIEGASLFSSSGALAPSKVVVGTQQQWYSSTSRTSLSGGSWATTQPSLTEGHYLWQRSLVTYANGNTSYLPTENGVCISEKSDVSVGGRNLILASKTIAMTGSDYNSRDTVLYKWTYSKNGDIHTYTFAKNATGSSPNNNAYVFINGQYSPGISEMRSKEYAWGLDIKIDGVSNLGSASIMFDIDMRPSGQNSNGTHTIILQPSNIVDGKWMHIGGYGVVGDSDTSSLFEWGLGGLNTVTGSFTISYKNPILVYGNVIPADWSPAPEDMENAIGETSRIYYRTNVSNFGTAPTAWVTSTATANNTWTRKRMPYDSTYNLIYTCEQRKSVSGAFLGCTEVLLDDTTTVIDGGHITTGTIDANRIAATSLSLGKLTTDAQNTISNAAKTASNYITADTNGIKIYNSSSASAYQYMSNSVFEIYNNDTSNPVISVNNTPSVRIGKSTSFNQYIDSSGVTYYNNGLVLATLKAYNTYSSITSDIGIKITTGQSDIKSYSYLDMTGAKFESSTTDVATIMAQSRNTSYYAQMWTKAITYQSQVTIEASNVPTSSDLKRAGYIDLASSKASGYDTFARIGYKDLNNSVNAALEIGKDCNHMYIHNPSVTDGSTQVLMGIKLSMAYIAFGTVANAHAYTANGVYFHKANGAPSWYQALTPSNSAIYVRNGANTNWNPVLTFQTSGGGTWSIGNYNSENFVLSHVTSGADSNSKASQIYIAPPADASVVTVPATSFAYRSYTPVTASTVATIFSSVTSGITISNISYVQIGQVAYLLVGFSKSTETSVNGSNGAQISVGTVISGKRPYAGTEAIGVNPLATADGVITTEGVMTYRSQIAVNANAKVWMKFIYLVGL